MSAATPDGPTEPAAARSLATRRGLFGGGTKVFYGSLGLVLGVPIWLMSGIALDIVEVVIIAASLCVLLTLGLLWIVFGALHVVKGGRRWGELAIAPVLVAAAVASAVTDLPANARWALSRPAFDRFAEAYEEDPQLRADGHLGLYAIDVGPRAVPGGFILRSGSSGLVGSAGFAYLPDPSTPKPELGDSGGATTLVHLSGPWYRWTAT